MRVIKVMFLILVPLYMVSMGVYLGGTQATILGRTAGFVLYWNGIMIPFVLLITWRPDGNYCQVDWEEFEQIRKLMNTVLVGDTGTRTTRELCEEVVYTGTTMLYRIQKTEAPKPIFIEGLRQKEPWKKKNKTKLPKWQRK